MIGGSCRLDDDEMWGRIEGGRVKVNCRMRMVFWMSKNSTSSSSTLQRRDFIEQSINHQLTRVSIAVRTDAMKVLLFKLWDS